MKKTFRPWQVDQSLLLPPTVHDFVPADHPAHFVRELVRDGLDLLAITDSYSRYRDELLSLLRQFGFKV